MDRQKTTLKKYILAGFVLFGLAAGFVAVWYHRHTDTMFLLNIPGALLGEAFYSLAIRWFGDPGSAQAHYTIPWLLRIPQVYVPASVVCWGLLGTLFAVFLKPRITAWIAGAYLAAGGGLYLLAGLGII